MDKLVVVARYSFPYQAHIAKGLLESEHILAFVADEHTINMQWLYSNAMGGVRLMVPESARERAELVLRNDYSENVNAELCCDTEVCPHCGSDDITPVTKGKRVAFAVFILLQFPLYTHDHGMKCNGCGHFWHSKP